VLLFHMHLSGCLAEQNSTNHLATRTHKTRLRVKMDAFSDIKPIPLDVILSWPKPNYVDPERRGPALVVVNCILLPLSLTVVGLRLYTRLMIVHSAGLDDLFIGLASVNLPTPSYFEGLTYTSF
jgi:hypothetical protein